MSAALKKRPSYFRLCKIMIPENKRTRTSVRRAGGDDLTAICASDLLHCQCGRRLVRAGVAGRCVNDDSRVLIVAHEFGVVASLHNQAVENLSIVTSARQTCPHAPYMSAYSKSERDFFLWLFRLLVSGTLMKGSPGFPAGDFCKHIQSQAMRKTASKPMAGHSEIQFQDLWLTTVSIVLR